jgi:hypothetical protein
MSKTAHTDSLQWTRHKEAQGVYTSKAIDGKLYTCTVISNTRTELRLNNTLVFVGSSEEECKREAEKHNQEFLEASGLAFPIINKNIQCWLIEDTKLKSMHVETSYTEVSHIKVNNPPKNPRYVITQGKFVADAKEFVAEFNDWRTIDTAPRDGTKLTLASFDTAGELLCRMGPMHWNPFETNGLVPGVKGLWACYKSDGSLEVTWSEHHPDGAPTHWKIYEAVAI